MPGAVTLAALLADVRTALAACRRAPAFAAAAILSIAIGLGANTALFSVTHALLLTPLPYPEPDRLAILWNRSPGLQIAEDWFSTGQFVDISTRHDGLEDVAIAIGAYTTVSGDGRDAERLGTIRASANLWRLLGARALHGRGLTEDDDRTGSPAVALLDHGTWTRRYGADPGVVGRTLSVNGVATEIVGVVDAGFTLPREVLPTLGVVERAELLLPLRLGPDAASVRTREDYNLIARLKAGVTFEAAQAEMDRLTAALREEHPHVYPPNGGLTFSLVPLHEQVVGRVRQPLVAVSVAVLIVLLIACANVAHLLLARGNERRRELAARAALGATRARLVQQGLVECLVISGAGAVVGAGLAWAGLEWARAVQPADLPRLAEVRFSLPVFAFTGAATLFAAMASGLLPALALSRADLVTALKAASRGSSAGATLWSRRHGSRRLLVVAELALALVLLVGAALLISSLARLERVPAGFAPNRVLTFELALAGRKYPDSPAVQVAYDRLWTLLGDVPGVEAAGGVTPLPLSQFFAWGPIQVEGRRSAAGERFVNADQRVATWRYFDTLGIALVEGRLFSPADRPGTDRVVIVDDHMAATLWPGRSAIGQRIRFGDGTTDTPWETVVGVVRRVRQYGLDADARMAFYRPHTQQPARTLYVTVKTAGDPLERAAAVRAAVRALDPDLPVFRMMTMTKRVEASTARRRFLMTVITVSAAVAAALALIGVYGLVAYLVSEGRRDLAIRLAVGASPAGVTGLVLTGTAALGASGVGLGLGLAYLAARPFEALLFEVNGRDPLVYAASGLGLLAVTVGAAMLPARRAARVDPVRLLCAD
jgi:predicted permease